MASDMKVANFRTLHYFIHMNIWGQKKRNNLTEIIWKPRKSFIKDPAAKSEAREASGESLGPAIMSKNLSLRNRYLP